LPPRAFQYQTPRRGHRAMVRDALAARRPGEHPPHGLPEFLRSALHRRHRPARRQSADLGGRRHCRGLPHPRRRRLRSRPGTGTRDTPRRQGRRGPDHGRAHAQGLSRASRRGAGDIRGLYPPPRTRCVESHVRTTGGRMTQPTRPPIAKLVPDSAPFTPEQRTWLNGFFAGFLELCGAGITALSPEANAVLISGLIPSAKGPLDDGDDGQAPWHDQTLPLAERMKLADGRPLRRRMMAAMGQQDCGQCGYNCEDYSNVIVLKKEERLNLCVRGGKKPARMRKPPNRELDEPPPAAGETPSSPPAAEVADRPAIPATPAERGRSRDNPVEAVFQSRTRLNKPGSGKETWHLEFDLKESGLDYTVGDSFGIYPTNDPALVAAVVKAIDAPPDFPIGGRTLRAVLQDSVSLSVAPDMLFQLISYITGGERRQKAKTLAFGQDPDGDAPTLDVLAAIQKFPGIRPDPEAFVESLDALQPRLYSIASSLKTNPGRLAFTVDAVRYDIKGRTRLV